MCTALWVLGCRVYYFEGRDVSGLLLILILHGESMVRYGVCKIVIPGIKKNVYLSKLREQKNHKLGMSIVFMLKRIVPQK